MYVTRYAWEMGGSLGIRGCSNTSQQEQFVTSNQSAYNSALVTTSLSRFLFKSKPGGRGWQQLEEEGEEEQSPE